jgi:hypothetical protein
LRCKPSPRDNCGFRSRNKPPKHQTNVCRS